MSAIVAGSLLLTLTSTLPGRAACNAFPAARDASPIEGANGAVNVPFASAGDVVRIENASIPAAMSVTAFVVSRSQPGTPVVVAVSKTAAECSAIENDIDACAIPGLVRECIEDGTLAAQTGTVEFAFPETPTGSVTFSLSGPSTLMVTTNGAVPCGLLDGTQTCASSIGTVDLLGCVGELFRTTSSGVKIAHPAFPTFVALPRPNVFRELCDRTSTGPMAICDGPASDLELALDADGNMLIPMSWDGLWPGISGPPYPERYVRASTAVKSHPGAFGPISTPSPDYLASLDATGRSHDSPPLFVQQDLFGHEFEITFVGTADKPRSVLHIARRIRVTHACVGGTNDGQACSVVNEPADCPNGGRCAELGTGYCSADGTQCTIGSTCSDGTSCACVGDFLCTGGSQSGTTCDPSATTPCLNGGSCECTPDNAVGFFHCTGVASALGQTCARNAHCPRTQTTTPRCVRARCKGNSAQTCRLDTDCTGGSGPCGIPLFDVSPHQPGGKHRPVHISRDPSLGGFSGVCNAPRGSANGAPCVSSSACPSGSECVMFRAELGWIVHTPNP